MTVKLLLSPLSMDAASLPVRKKTRFSIDLPSPAEYIGVPPRFAKVKQALVQGNEAAIEASWRRLLKTLKEEIESLPPAEAADGCIPTIDFCDIAKEGARERFAKDLRKRGAAVIRNVITQDEALTWKQQAEEYLEPSPAASPGAAADPELHNVFWSPPQVRARGHRNVLAAQKFVMGCWNSNKSDSIPISYVPITYADRLRVRKPKRRRSGNLVAHIDCGSVERWERDGYGRAGTYAKIFEGKWEEYDPWESSSRSKATTDLYNGVGCCSVFRMFQGVLSLSPVLQEAPPLLVCPSPTLTTAYVLLRPFFAPKNPNPNASGFLDADNWKFETPQKSALQGAMPGNAQEVTNALHPHLHLARSLVPIPELNPGDYIVWHPDLVHAWGESLQPPTRSGGGSGGGNDDSDDDEEDADAAGQETYLMYLPACPLTQTTALYLARQRKAFLLGSPGPDFEGGSSSSSSRGWESGHAGRSRTQDVAEAGGGGGDGNGGGEEDALRAMGLQPWDEEEAGDDAEREVLALANGILFPDRYDGGD